MQRPIAWVTACSFFLCAGGQAAAQCAAGDITGMAQTSASLAPYSPFVPFPPKLVTVTVNGSRPCSVEIAVYSPVAPLRMTGPGQLVYEVQNPVGAASIAYSAGVPAATVRVDIGAGGTGSGTVQVAVPPGQVVADGVYTDTSPQFHVLDHGGPGFAVLRSAAMAVTGSVAKACQFTVPSSPTLNFTAAIGNGRPNQGHVLSATFEGISCTAPTLVRLSGAAMALQPPAGASSVLDQHIDYRAGASFGSASAMLDTSVASEAQSATRNVGAGTTVNGSLRVDVNLLAGKPLMAGTYASILTLSVDPSP